MTHATDIKTLACWLSADFSNLAQHNENPPFYAHIRVCIRPLPLCQFPEPTLFLEQAYDFMLNRPYRLRALRLKVVGDHIEIENYKVNPEDQFYGAARDLSKLQSLTPEHLVKMSGCDMNVTWTGHSFQGQVQPGKQCKVIRDGQETYLDSRFEISPGKFISLDRGYNPATDELVWGSVAGEFHFEQRASFSQEVEF